MSRTLFPAKGRAAAAFLDQSFRHQRFPHPRLTNKARPFRCRNTQPAVCLPGFQDITDLLKLPFYQGISDYSIKSTHHKNFLSSLMCFSIYHRACPFFITLKLESGPADCLDFPALVAESPTGQKCPTAHCTPCSAAFPLL